MDNLLLSRLVPLRDKIDELDEQILDLLNKRSNVVVEIGKIKHCAHIESPVLRPERESQVIDKLKKNNKGPFPNKSIEPVWVEIMSACRNLEKQMTVSYLGPKGSFSEQAVFEHFGHTIDVLPCSSFDDVVHAIETGSSDAGMIPIENSIEGAVNRSLDLLLNTNLKIMGERSLIINHFLLTKNGNMDGIERIMAHPQALAQCQMWLNKNHPGLLRVAASSNSEAASIASKDHKIAAIAGEAASKAWGLSIVSSRIQDDANNRTRFVSLGNIEPLPSSRDKTSLILSVPNRACAVYEMIEPFASNCVSMTRFESRPARTGQWEYYFYIDVLGHKDEPNVFKALEKLKSSVAFFKLLGSYPAQ
ncbi:bifunctional chorismate mutase/prephenate dehydratase [Candidatus Kinetoplastibacterium blastocrithidii TCC012E]|uniref:Bifunctional chorismate mutase/prephenate dehydratase n=1 Tax=Candidatus Kinetoplastidibacterium blastocrithidiae TCC012E TaxID=1208922 RepID=M1LWF3_9PROT|nr:prephenate dehydratase [Candidatus Kinetoplastibacterium blastocrithidii]AFZ83734.1 chorismate mutase [Candidatus Kinetoplastibacterium blastocrithidii (ex Strigomonas culicis)]AGF49857.1 bifunctional chorismate mutase/prephenate dehydratase [Candidatus Kinetoplastibacterium blastocrithidii TCC012E]